MEMVALIDKAAIEAAKVEAVFRALPWPHGSGKEADQLADMLLVLADQIQRMEEAVNELEKAADKNQVA